MRALTSLILALLVTLAPSAQAAGCTCAPSAPEERSCSCCCELDDGASCGCCSEQDGPAAAWDSCDCVQVQPQCGAQAADEFTPEGLEFALPVDAAERPDRTSEVDSPARATLPPGFLLPLLV